MLLMAAGPLLGISEVASCGFAVTTGLRGSAVSRPVRAFHSFRFGFDITIVVKIRHPYK
jgi:hypothetical protein